MLENISCPLTRSPMRHPLIVIDCEGNAHRYELEAFFEHLQSLQERAPFSPMTNKQIASVGYDTDFKQILDSNPDVEGRYKDYNKLGYMQFMNNKFRQNDSRFSLGSYFRAPSVRSIGTGLVAYLAVSISYHEFSGHAFDSSEHREQDIISSHSIPIGIMAGVLDYGIRYCTNYRYSLPSTLFNLAAKALEPVSNKARDVINQIHRRHHA